MLGAQNVPCPSSQELQPTNNSIICPLICESLLQSLKGNRHSASVDIHLTFLSIPSLLRKTQTSLHHGRPATQHHIHSGCSRYVTTAPSIPTFVLTSCSRTATKCHSCAKPAASLPATPSTTATATTLCAAGRILFASALELWQCRPKQH